MLFDGDGEAMERANGLVMSLQVSVQFSATEKCSLREELDYAVCLELSVSLCLISPVCYTYKTLGNGGTFQERKCDIVG